MVAEDWSEWGGNPLGPRWKAEGTWKGRTESLASTPERPRAGGDCMILISLHCFFPLGT